MQFAALDPGSQQLCGLPARCPDTHVTVVPEMAGVIFPPRLAPGHQREPNTGFAPVSRISRYELQTNAATFCSSTLPQARGQELLVDCTTDMVWRGTPSSAEKDSR